MSGKHVTQAKTQLGGIVFRTFAVRCCSFTQVADRPHNGQENSCTADEIHHMEDIGLQGTWNTGTPNHWNKHVKTEGQKETKE